ncbi:Phosphatidylinositol-glycan biosynthesis class W protein [Gryllus bimaculatus]|nr:Phosphatidylinositol-glycan biosynthesis class W protein [Gryllus bimaculatus]
MLACVSILAVDFKIFPRRFAKTETFGYSPMDAGVGLFCISNSVIVPSAILHKRIETNSCFKDALIKTLKSCIPLVLLGGARFFTTTQVDYQLHISEYGVHWNFFLTLAACKLISFFISRDFGTKCSLVTSLIVITVHEIILYKGLQKWVLSDISRDSFLTANREGIASSLGYVALFMAGMGIGNLMYCESNTIGDLIVLVKKFTLFSVFLWTTSFACQDCLIVSRRLANFGYYMWILTFSVTTLTVFMIIDLFLQTLKLSSVTKTEKRVTKDSEGHVPILFNAINYNGLAFFLIANVFTGLINLSIQTLWVNDMCSVIIIFLYAFVISAITFLLYCKNIQLKAW